MQDITTEAVPHVTYIYALADPRTPDVIRYVGKANKPKVRYGFHVRLIDAPKHDTHKARWIRGLVKAGLMPVMQIIDCVTYTEDSEWAAVEIARIAQYRSDGHPLTNTCDGGSRRK